MSEAPRFYRHRDDSQWFTSFVVRSSQVDQMLLVRTVDNHHPTRIVREELIPTERFAREFTLIIDNPYDAIVEAFNAHRS